MLGVEPSFSDLMGQNTAPAYPISSKSNTGPSPTWVSSHLNHSFYFFGHCFAGASDFLVETLAKRCLKGCTSVSLAVKWSGDGSPHGSTQEQLNIFCVRWCCGQLMDDNTIPEAAKDDLALGFGGSSPRLVWPLVSVVDGGTSWQKPMVCRSLHH